VEGTAISVASNAIQTGHLGINVGDLEGASIGGALSAAEAKIPMQWANFYEKSGVDFAERSFNSLVENAAITGHARVDWIDAGIGTGLDMLNAWSNTRQCASRGAKANEVEQAIGATPNGQNNAVGGHYEYGIGNVSSSQLAAAGYSSYSSPFGNQDVFHNSSLFNQAHINVRSNDMQIHFDTFNPAAGPVGLALHGVWDLGIGSILFSHGSVLDSGCL
jgi:hypothetical protein